MSTVQGIPEYREIQGFPGYRVGDDGTVWSCRKLIDCFRPSQRSICTNKWRQLKGRVSKKLGYPIVQLRRDGETHPKYVHHLVLEAFVGPRPEGFECCHRDGNRANNARTNLRWGTHQENVDDTVSHGRTTSGERHGGAILTDQIVIAIRNHYKRGTITQKKLADKYGVHIMTINDIIKHRTWKHLICREREPSQDRPA